MVLDRARNPAQTPDSSTLSIVARGMGMELILSSDRSSLVQMNRERAILRFVARTYDPTEGPVLVDGQDVDFKMLPFKVRRRIFGGQSWQPLFQESGP